MSIISMNLDFVLNHVGFHGREIASDALRHGDVALQSMFDAGWAQAVREKSVHQSRLFLTAIRFVEDPVAATDALRQFMRGADTEEVNNLLMGKAPHSDYEAVALSWNLSPKTPPDVLKALLEESKSMGMDLTRQFSYSSYQTGTLKSAKHTVLSAALAHHASRNHGIDDAEKEYRFAKIQVLLEVGFEIDKPTSAVLVQNFKPEDAKPWIMFFKEQGMCTAQGLLLETSRLKIDSESKAMLQSIAAAEAIESVIQVIAPTATKTKKASGF